MAGLREMMERHARVGWTGARRLRRSTVDAADNVDIALDGPADNPARAGKQTVTRIRSEHLHVIAALLERNAVLPETLRRNIVVSGIGQAAWRKERVRSGEVVLPVAGSCPPCTRMDEYPGPGGYSAVRGHGGLFASVGAGRRVVRGHTVARAD